MTKLRDAPPLAFLLLMVGHIIQLILLSALLFQVKTLKAGLETDTRSAIQTVPSTPVPSPPTIISEDISIGDSPVKGDSEALVTIVEFSDFECPYCQRARKVMDQLLQRYDGQVQLAHRDFPLQGIHPHAFQAAVAARCAQEQGKFWEMHDKLFENQYALAVQDIERYATEIDLELERFRICMESEKYAEKVAQDVQVGQRYGVVATPTFFVNKYRIVGLQPLSVFEEIIDRELMLRR